MNNIIRKYNLALKANSVNGIMRQGIKSHLKSLYYLNAVKRFSFWSSSNYKTSSKAENADLITLQDGTLARSNDYDAIYDFDDKFNLSKITDHKKIFSLLKQGNFNYKVNDLIYFLRRIVQINEQKHLKLDVHNTPDLATLIKKIKDELREANQEYPLIGSYAWCFWKLGHANDQELWLTLADHIVDDRFYPNFKESVYAIEGFTMLKQHADQKFIDEVYKKLERICTITIWEVDMTYYKRIAESLVQVNRFTPYVFDKLEHHIKNNLSMEYDLKTMLDILFAFALSNNGSKGFYNAMQQIMVKGHMHHRLPHLQLHSELPSHGNFVAKLVETYALAKYKHPDLQLEPDFIATAYNLITNKKAKYSLEDLVRVMQNVYVFEFEEIDKVNQILDDKLFEIDENMNADDMIRYIDLKVNRDYDGDYHKIPKKILVFFDDYLNKNITSQDPHKIYHYICEIESRGLLVGKEEFLNKLIQYVSKQMVAYDFEEMCYYFWLFNKYHTMVDQQNKHVQQAMTQIKDHIRLYSAFSKGRLRIGSNFYKMLEVVSGSEFLTQGEYPDW